MNFAIFDAGNAGFFAPRLPGGFSTPLVAPFSAAPAPLSGVIRVSKDVVLSSYEFHEVLVDNIMAAVASGDAVLASPVVGLVPADVADDDEDEEDEVASSDGALGTFGLGLGPVFNATFHAQSSLEHRLTAAPRIGMFSSPTFGADQQFDAFPESPIMTAEQRRIFNNDITRNMATRGLNLSYWSADSSQGAFDSTEVQDNVTLHASSAYNFAAINEVVENDEDDDWYGRFPSNPYGTASPAFETSPLFNVDNAAAPISTASACDADDEDDGMVNWETYRVPRMPVPVFEPVAQSNTSARRPPPIYIERSTFAHPAMAAALRGSGASALPTGAFGLLPSAEIGTVAGEQDTFTRHRSNTAATVATCGTNVSPNSLPASSPIASKASSDSLASLVYGSSSGSGSGSEADTDSDNAADHVSVKSYSDNDNMHPKIQRKRKRYHSVRSPLVSSSPRPSGSTAFKRVKISPAMKNLSIFTHAAQLEVNNIKAKTTEIANVLSTMSFEAFGTLSPDMARNDDDSRVRFVDCTVIISEMPLESPYPPSPGSMALPVIHIASRVEGFAAPSSLAFQQAIKEDVARQLRLQGMGIGMDHIKLFQEEDAGRPEIRQPVGLRSMRISSSPKCGELTREHFTVVVHTA